MDRSPQGLWLRWGQNGELVREWNELVLSRQGEAGPAEVGANSTPHV